MVKFFGSETADASTTQFSGRMAKYLKEEQFLKASAPMAVTPAGRKAETRAALLMKASAGNVVRAVK